jgi:DNA-binding response OmpR family regulator
MSEPIATVRRVLVIASPAITAELEAALQMHGIEVQKPNPKGRDTLLEANAPELVWLEHDPPLLDALTTLEQLRSTRTGAALPVVIFAASWNAASLFRAAQARASSCLQWPTADREGWLRDITQYWTSINEPAT